MFNFGAFAGGLATAIQTQQKLNLEEKKYDEEIENAKAKLKLEGDKLKKQQEDDIKKAEKDKADGAVKVEEVMGKTDIGLEARINQANNMSKIYGLGTAKAMMTDPTSGEKFVADVTQNLLPEIDKIQKDLDIYKNEGNYKLDNTGALYTRPNAESEFTPIGFKGTNAKAFTKEGIDYTKGLELFTTSGDSVKVYSPNEAKQYEQQGFGRVKPKIDSSPKVEIKIGDKGKDYANIATDARTKLKNIESGGKITPDDESNLMASEFTLTETMDAKQKDKRQEVRDTLDTVQNLKEIKNTTKRLMDSGVKGGIAQDAVVGVMKYVGTGGKFSDLADMDDAKFKSITGLEAASTAQKMEIIKSLSGLSYTDKQAEMMNKITGDGWGKTNEAKYNAMDGYIKDQERKLKGIASTNNTFSSTSPYTSAMVLKTLGAEAPQPKQVGLAGNLPVMQDEKGEYIEINGVKKYKGVK